YRENGRRPAFAVFVHPPHFDLRAIVGELDPHDDSRVVLEQLDSDAAGRTCVVDTDRRSKCLPGVVRESHERAPLVTGGGEPCDGNVAAARADGGSVYRTGLDLPAVFVNPYGHRPLLACQTRHVDISRLVRAPASVGDEHTLGRRGGGSRTALTNAR